MVNDTTRLLGLEDVAVTKGIDGRRGRKGNREWELRNRLTRLAARMHRCQLDPVIDDLQALPAKIERIRQ